MLVVMIGPVVPIIVGFPLRKSTQEDEKQSMVLCIPYEKEERVRSKNFSVTAAAHALVTKPLF